MSQKTKTALDALLALSSEARGLVLCWFCDACREYIGPGETHRCEAGADDPDVPQMCKELADVVECDRDWDLLLAEVRRLKRLAEQKLQVTDIIGILRGMDIMSGVMDRIELQLSDEAVYEHLKTCANVLDDEDHKRMLIDAAELFADEFCNDPDRRFGPPSE